MPEERGLYPKTKVGPQLEYLARLHGLSTAAPRAAAHEWTDRLGIAERYDDNVAELRTRDGQFLDVAGPEPASRLADGLPGVLAADYGADCTRLHRCWSRSAWSRRRPRASSNCCCRRCDRPDCSGERAVLRTGTRISGTEVCRMLVSRWRPTIREAAMRPADR